eukprot:TRINITY_DN12355_c0_g2_i1.p1 TRINITY_DN12355_c0_g2~~TRINITY_DN12355_c0_g2_i1.p1  ORF type:complete len:282 (-),score=50.07 TRINITY_DN12355_c0_g2_i1:11-856(-)
MKPTFYVEQAAILTWGLVALFLSIRQIRLQKKPENASLVKPVQFVFMRALLFSGALETIWSVDPRGLWYIYPALFLAFIKDFVFITFIACGIFWTDTCCRVLLETQGRLNVAGVSKWMTCGVANGLHFSLDIVLNVLGFIWKSDFPRAVFQLCQAAILLLVTIGATMCLAYVKHVRNRAGMKMMRDEQERFWNKLMIVAVCQWVLVICAITLAVMSLRAPAITFQDFQVSESPYFTVMLVFHASGLAMIYTVGMLPRENNKFAAIGTTHGTPVITPTASNQ